MLNETRGAINVLKPPGLTSHDVVAIIRKIYNVKRVGHAGTLDPAAAGALPIFIGKSTRLIEYITCADKSYRAQITFGYKTDTGDDTGKVIEKAGVMPSFSKNEIEQALSAFIGEIEQLPPMYSAIKIQGKKLYQLAREGKTVERNLRKITVYSLKLVGFTDSGVLIDVHCSKGTYIRTLCEDIGEKLGTLAVMSFLLRTGVGGFKLADSFTLEEIAENKERVLLAAEDILDLPIVKLKEEEDALFRNGRRITITIDEDYFSSLTAATCARKGENPAFKAGVNCALVPLGKLEVNSTKGSDGISTLAEPRLHLLGREEFLNVSVFASSGAFLGIGRFFLQDKLLIPVKVLY